MTSEFGKGFVYNLILFAQHFDRIENLVNQYSKLNDKKLSYQVWFNEASDHLYELEIPEQWKDTEIGKLAKEIQHKAIEFGHGFKVIPKKKDFQKICQKTNKLALLIDKKLGIKSIKATYS